MQAPDDDDGQQQPVNAALRSAWCTPEAFKLYSCTVEGVERWDDLFWTWQRACAVAACEKEKDGAGGRGGEEDPLALIDEMTRPVPPPLPLPPSPKRQKTQ